MRQPYDTLIQALKAQNGRGTSHSRDPSYMGTAEIGLDISMPVQREVFRSWKSKNQKIPFSEYVETLERLFSGKHCEEKSIAGLLLGGYPSLRKLISPILVESWADSLSGWAEVDSICQSVFDQDDLLSQWSDWSKVLRRLSLDKNPNKRRASLVLLTLPMRKSSDKRLVELALELLSNQVGQNDKLITKAMSWLLRDMVTRHQRDVLNFISTNGDSLPQFVVREVSRKIKTGTKSGRAKI